jgi:hypothetical protein
MHYPPQLLTPVVVAGQSAVVVPHKVSCPRVSTLHLWHPAEKTKDHSHIFHRTVFAPQVFVSTVPSSSRTVAHPSWFPVIVAPLSPVSGCPWMPGWNASHGFREMFVRVHLSELTSRSWQPGRSNLSVWHVASSCGSSGLEVSSVGLQQVKAMEPEAVP